MNHDLIFEFIGLYREYLLAYSAYLSAKRHFEFVADQDISRMEEILKELHIDCVEFLNEQ